MLYPSLLHPEPLSPQQATTDPYLYRRHSNTVLSQSLWGACALVLTRFAWALPASKAGMQSDSKCKFTPLTILLGPLPRPWIRGISSQTLQCLQSYWSFSDVGCGASPHPHPVKCSRCSWPWMWGYFLLAPCCFNAATNNSTPEMKRRSGSLEDRPQYSANILYG